MCRAIEDGGRRCLPHLKQRVTYLTKVITQQEEAGEDTTAVKAERENVSNEIVTREAEQAEELRAQQARAAEREADKAVRAARREARAEAKRTGQPVTYGTSANEDIPKPPAVRFAISEELNQKVEADAKAAGMKFSAYVRQRLSEPLSFEAKPVTEVPALTGTSPRGRATTEESKRRSVIRTVRVPKAVRKQLDELASELSLTTSDLVRIILEGRDPRQNGGHMAAPAVADDARATSVRRKQHFARLEEHIGADGEAIASYYQGLYKDALPARIGAS